MRKILSLHPGIACHYLMVAQGGLFRTPHMVQTVLGSCVSVTFHHRTSGLGGLFHALLPRMEEYERLGGDGSPYKYVDTAIEQLCAEIVALGLRPTDFECKVFGGAGAVFRNEIAIGRRNVQAALDALAARRLRVIASSVGGETGRKLAFLTHTGEVYLKFLKNRLNQPGRAP